MITSRIIGTLCKNGFDEKGVKECLKIYSKKMKNPLFFNKHEDFFFFGQK